MFDGDSKVIYAAKNYLYLDSELLLGKKIDLHVTDLLWVFKSIPNGNTITGLQYLKKLIKTD
jgi:hypothetical protein